MPQTFTASFEADVNNAISIRLFFERSGRNDYRQELFIFAQRVALVKFDVLFSVLLRGGSAVNNLYQE